MAKKLIERTINFDDLPLVPPEIHIEDALIIVDEKECPVIAWWFVHKGKKYGGHVFVRENAEREARRVYERVVKTPSVEIGEDGVGGW